MNELNIFEEPSACRDAAVRRAYMRGFRDAVNSGEAGCDAQNTSAAAMAFGFLCWAAMMYFVFR